MKEYIPWTGDKRAREAWEEIFSREVLGAVVMGSAASKVVESCIVIWVEGLTQGNIQFLIAWAITFFVGMVLFIKWHKIMDTARETAEDAVDTAGIIVDDD